jgi:hypothetical protein
VGIDLKRVLSMGIVGLQLLNIPGDFRQEVLTKNWQWGCAESWIAVCRSI